MFDGVTYREGISRQLRLGPGALLGIVLYLSIGLVAVWWQSRPRTVDTAVPVTFVKPPPPPPPPPPGGGSKASTPKAKPVVKPVSKDALIAPTVVPEAVVPQPMEEAPGGQPGGVEGGVEGGVAGGTVGGQVGGVLGGVLGSDGSPLEWDASRMTQPDFVSGPNPECTDAASSRNVKGKMHIRCLVTADGKVHDCKVVKSLPFMNDAVISALERRTYKPALLGGRPVDAYYQFSVSVSCAEE